MCNISLFVRKGKQAKKGDDCTVRIVPHGMLTVQVVRSIQADMAAPEDDTWHLLEVTHGR
jgi:hypothetical protein